MAKLDKYNDLVTSIVDLVGGKDNISSFAHCVTRLRFTVKDKGLVKYDEVEKLGGAVGCQWVGDQLQVIIGANVEDVYNAICKKHSLNSESAIDENLDGGKKKFSIQSALATFSGCLQPVIPALIACGVLKIFTSLGSLLGFLDKSGTTYALINMVGDAAIYYLPVFVGAATAKKFGINSYLGALLGAMLIHPTFVANVSGGVEMTLFGLPVYAGSYTNSIFPAFLTVMVFSYIYKFVNKYVPDILKSIVTPLVSMLIILPLSFCALAPIGQILGEYVASILLWFYNTFGFIGLGLYVAVRPLITVTGMHMALTPMIFQLMGSLGYDPFVCIGSVLHNIAEGATCLAIAVKSKNKETKSSAITCGFSSMVAAVSEPAMFGFTFKNKAALIGVVAGGAVGGMFAGLVGLKFCQFAGGMGLLGIASFASDVYVSNFMFAIAAIAITMVVTFVTTFILYKEEN